MQTHAIYAAMRGPLRAAAGLACSTVTLVAVAGIGLSGCSSPPAEQPVVSDSTTVEEIRAFFEDQGKEVVTFVGYSGAGYEDQGAMLNQARHVLDEFDVATTVVNIGATPDGIGAVYELAKDRGFTTTGIVSTQAREYEAEISPFADHVFFVQDTSWGGLIEGTDQLSPTSTAMVGCSDLIVGLGGGEVARDELLIAQRLGKEVRFYPFDMNHQRAIDKAARKGVETPTDFRGAAHLVFASSSDP